MKGRTIIQILLGVVIVALAYLLYNSIQKPVRFENEYNKRRDACAEKLKAILWDGLGIAREERTLAAALEKLETVLSENLTPWERNRALLGKAMLVSALERKESRGAHYRRDHPDRDDERFRKTTVAVCRDGAVTVTYRPIPERTPVERRLDHGTNP